MIYGNFIPPRVSGGCYHRGMLKPTRTRYPTAGSALPSPFRPRPPLYHGNTKLARVSPLPAARIGDRLRSLQTTTRRQTWKKKGVGKRRSRKNEEKAKKGPNPIPHQSGEVPPPRSFAPEASLSLPIMTWRCRNHATGMVHDGVARRKAGRGRGRRRTACTTLHLLLFLVQWHCRRSFAVCRPSGEGQKRKKGIAPSQMVDVDGCGLRRICCRPRRSEGPRRRIRRAPWGQKMKPKYPSKDGGSGEKPKPYYHHHHHATTTTRPSHCHTASHRKAAKATSHSASAPLGCGPSTEPLLLSCLRFVRPLPFRHRYASVRVGAIRIVRHEALERRTEKPPRPHTCHRTSWSPR